MTMSGARTENEMRNSSSNEGMIRGQCMQVLLDKMKYDPDWNKTSESYSPLALLQLIEKTILAQT